MTRRTLKDLERLLKNMGSDGNRWRAMIRRDLIAEGGTYQEFVKQLYKDLDLSIYQLQSTREHRQKDDEDRITRDIELLLQRDGYRTKHDAKSGGHVDLSVELSEHSWLAEAKKDGGSVEGLLQLTTRYVQPSESARFPWRPVGLSQASIAACSARCR